MNNYFTRFYDLIDQNILDTLITVIGAGSIGSFVVLNLKMMGFTNVTVIDFDEVDDVNVGIQLFGPEHIGKPKVHALNEIIKYLTGGSINAVYDKYTGGKFDGVVITALDNMDTRKLVWKEHKMNMGTKFIIDPRMGAEDAQMYCMNPMNPKDFVYEKHLYSDEEANPAVCTAKAIVYTVSMVGGLVAQTVKQSLMKKNYLRNVQWCIRDGEFYGFKVND